MRLKYGDRSAAGHELDTLDRLTFEAIWGDEGYISVVLLAQLDDHQTFPPLPFEPIDLLSD